MEQPLNHLRHRLPRIAGALLLAAVLGAVFMAYLRPSFVVDLANRIMLCM
jgi:hypothetical protein